MPEETNLTQELGEMDEEKIDSRINELDRMMGETDDESLKKSIKYAKETLEIGKKFLSDAKKNSITDIEKEAYGSAIKVVKNTKTVLSITDEIIDIRNSENPDIKFYSKSVDLLSNLVDLGGEIEYGYEKYFGNKTADELKALETRNSYISSYFSMVSNVFGGIKDINDLINSDPDNFNYDSIQSLIGNVFNSIDNYYNI